MTSRHGFFFLGERVFPGVLLSVVLGACLLVELPARAESACLPLEDANGAFDSCEPWESPFASHSEWTEFMRQGASEREVAALRQAWSEEEFDGWRLGLRGSTSRVSFRSGALRLRGLLVRPEGPGPFPAVVYARGGNREWGRLRFLDVVRMQTIAETGRVVLAVEYRGEGGSEGAPELGAGDVTDLRSAALAVGKLPDVDADRIDVVGFSRGGLVAAWALESPTPFRSGVLIAGDLDLAATAERRPQMDSEVYRLSVSGYADDRDSALREASPLHAVGRLANVPLLLLHASDDERVHPSGSLEFAARWTAAGRSARVVVYQGGGHGLLVHSAELRRELESWWLAGPGTSRASGRRDSRSSAGSQLLVPRYGLSLATDGRFVYASGGAPSGGRNGPDFMRQGLLSLVERIDPESLESTYFSNGLHRRANHASAFAWNSVVSCGGRTQVGLDRFRVASCEILDLENGIFRELAPLPEPLRTLGMVEVGGSLYVVGGLTGGGEFSRATLKLSTPEANWTALQELPTPREGEVVSVGLRLYAIGGYNGEAMRAVQVFDIASGTWTQLPDLPYALSAFSAVSDGVAIYLFGDYERLSAIHRYDPQERRLERLDLEITPRRHSDAVLVEDRVIVVGGNQSRSGVATRVIEAFELEDLRNAPVRE